MKGVKRKRGDWLPKEDPELLKKHNRKMKSMRGLIGQDGAIVVLERMLNEIAEYSEEKWHSILYTAERQRIRNGDRKKYKEKYKEFSTGK